MFDYQKVRIVGATRPRLTKTIPVYDSMVESATKISDLEVTLSADEFIAYTARVSNPSNQGNTKTAGKLVKYLLDNAHVSPLEMVHVVMEIKTTRDIGRQILRHRSFSFQEFSQRYAEVADVIKIREARLQDNKNRQNSIELSDDDFYRDWETFEDKPKSVIFARMQEKIASLAVYLYSEALRMGIAKEQARAILPEGLTMSTMYMAGTLRSWLHYCQLRCANGTQKEHMDIAIKARDLLIEEFPSCKEYLIGSNETL